MGGVRKVAGEASAWCLHQVRRETITPRSSGASFPTCLRAPNEHSLRCPLQTAAKKTGYGGTGMWDAGSWGPSLAAHTILTALELAWLSLSKRNFRFDLGEFLFLASEKRERTEA